MNPKLFRLSLLPGRRACAAFFVLAWLAGGIPAARGEAMLQLFNVNWDELTRKMPEIAEAGYTSLWLPPPAKAGSVYSVGYDLFDPFDLGDKNQRGTTRTRYGTKAELQKVVETAHRFGIRVYFDNIMNHRGFDVPGYNANTPTNLYPGLTVEDFHLRRQADGTCRNWDNISDWSNVWQVQHRPLFGLIDLANENNSNNENFGAVEGNTIAKPFYVRQPGNNSYYMDTNLPAIAGSWRPFNGSSGDPVAEDVNAYLIRAAMWTLAETRCDGFRFDAVKHVPDSFFGATSATTDGYVGAIQTMYDYVHGYGNNVTGNGYVEGDNNRNSCFDTETTRNDALLFGEHLGEPPGFTGYIDRGMRLLGSPLHYYLNNTLGVGSLDGLQSRDPSAAVFSPINSVLFAQSHDDGTATHRELHNAYNFFHEGVPSIYSDGYNQSSAPDYFPRVAYAPYLGQFGDNKMPEVAYLHHQLARGGTRPRWGDADICAFERYDYREPGTAANQTVVLFAMNDNYSAQGDIAFVDGEGETFPSGVNKPPGTLGDAQGLAVGFPPGSVLVQLATATPGYDRTYKTVVVRPATNNRGTANNGTVYVGGQTIPAGGGAIEILIPSGGYVAYGYQWPEASRANPATNAIVLKQGGVEVPRITVTRTDGANGDAGGFNPVYPFKMRGSVDAFGNILGGVHVSNLTYAIDVPIVTNANFDILVRSDSSSVNALVKLDGGMDLNSQMGLGTANNGVGPNGPDLRDNKPGVATDVFLGYEQTAFQFRDNPEKFAAKNTLSNNIVSVGAETYYYTVGSAGSDQIVPGSGYGQSIGQTAAWIYHNPTGAMTVTNNLLANQRVPLIPNSGQPTDIYIQIGYANWINTCFLYYTTDGSNPEGAFGAGKGTTQVVQAQWIGPDNGGPDGTGTKDWWKVTLPGLPGGTPVRYKVGTFYGGSGGSIYAGANAAAIPDSDTSGAKLYGLTQAAITNFNPTTAVVWLHNDLNTNSTTIGLQPGFHIIRARTFLPRTNQSSVYNTFAQTFYYAGALPGGVIAYPTTDGTTIGSSSYTVVVRADSTVTGVEFNIADSLSSNDDAVTGKANGNGLNVFVAATAVSPDSGLGAQYPGYPQEYRFVYTNVPTSGTATITVRLKEFATTVYTNRFTTLTRTVNTAAPTQTLDISSPATNGTLLTYTNSATYIVRACFSTALPTANSNDFNILINGVLQPQASYIVRPVGAVPGVCPGLRSVTYNWNNPAMGTNLIQVIYTNALVPYSDARSIIVAPPLLITGLENNNQLVVWDSAPGVNYQVLATTNLAQPFLPISDIVIGTGSSTFYYDTHPAEQKFYQIQMVQ